MKEQVNVLPILQAVVRERQVHRPQGITICESTDLTALAGLNMETHVGVLPQRLESSRQNGDMILIDTHGNLGVVAANGNAKA